MRLEPLQKQTFERLSFVEDNILFGSFMLRGNESDILGVEQFPRELDAAGLCICLEGESEGVINGRSYQIRKGDMCVAFPNDILHIRSKSRDFKGYTIACTPEFLKSMNLSFETSIYFHIKNNPCISLKEREQKDLIKMCEFLKVHDSREDHPCREEISRILGTAITYEVIGIYKKKDPLPRQPHSRKRMLYFEFIELMAKNYREQKDVAFYAENLCITSRYLSAVCSEICGLTAKECIHQHTIIHARILLDSTDMTVSQIADELNFANPSFFTQYFKKRTGVTPKEYRNKELRK